MSEDKELVEVWRGEFENANANLNTERHPEGDYIRDPVHYMWQGFLMGKRSQPSVVLPKRIYSYPMHARKEIQDSLTAAGIKYTIEDLKKS